MASVIQICNSALNQLGACKFRERIDHRMGTKKINEKDFETSRLKLENEIKRLTKIVNNEVS